MYSFIAHAPQLIRVELERLQLLFLLRMKDSASFFKDSLMKFLTLSSSNPDAILERAAAEASGESSVDSRLSRDEVEAVFTADDDSNTPAVESSDSRSPGHERAQSPLDVTVSVGGCLILEALEANIMLPSLYTSKLAKGTNTEVVPEEIVSQCGRMPSSSLISKSYSASCLTKSTPPPSHIHPHTYSYSQPPPLFSLRESPRE